MMTAYRYRFCDRIDLREARETLTLALLAAEGLFGPSRVRADASWADDESINTLVIDAGTPVGAAINRIFLAFITAEFGADAFDVRRVEIIGAFLAREGR